MITYLVCDHCGGEAIQADRNGLFYDGDGDACENCGFPGTVSADGEEAYWRESDDPDALCKDPACWGCNESRATKRKEG